MTTACEPPNAGIARAGADIAPLIYNACTRAGFTHHQLAQLVGTSPPCPARGRASAIRRERRTEP